MSHAKREVHIPMTPEEHREWWESNSFAPYGRCWCGCGGETRLATHGNAKELRVKGCPSRYLVGHAGRIPLSQCPDHGVNRTGGYCECGCGELAPICPRTDVVAGAIEGQPRRFKKGHSAVVYNEQKRAQDFNASTNQRRCGECREWLPATTEHFYRSEVKVDGLWSRCIACEAERYSLYRKQNRHKISAKAQRRRALLLSVEGQHSAEDILQMFEDQGHRCAYCEKLLEEGFHVDHMMPLSKGGTNNWDNLAIACASCNCSKRAKTVEEFIEWIA